MLCSARLVRVLSRQPAVVAAGLVNVGLLQGSEQCISAETDNLLEAMEHSSVAARRNGAADGFWSSLRHGSSQRGSAASDQEEMLAAAASMRCSERGTALMAGERAMVMKGGAKQEPEVLALLRVPVVFATGKRITGLPLSAKVALRVPD
jgi:hypothetical protein